MVSENLTRPQLTSRMMELSVKPSSFLEEHQINVYGSYIVEVIISELKDISISTKYKYTWPTP